LPPAIKLAALVSLCALVALSACAGEGIVDPAGPGPQCTDVAPFRATMSCIQQFVFTPRCALSGCHASPSAAQGMDLSAGSAWTSIVNVPVLELSGYLRVKPGDPDNSYLVLKLEGQFSIIVGDRMPADGSPYLNSNEISVIREWIANGAPDN
jgi:hypothetical protein